MNFFEKLEAAARERRSLLCVGLDPRVDAPTGESAFEAIVAENRRIISATSRYACCYKPNSAFYEQHGDHGIRALAETIRLVPPEIPVLLDCKRGDIGSTAEAYARYAFSFLQADAVTLAPYMGRDGVKPFLAYDVKGGLILTRPSNPSAGTLQERRVEGRALYRAVAAEALGWSDRIGLVVAGNNPAVLEEIRRAHRDAWILAPGIGAQGGEAAPAVAAGSRSDGLGLLLVAARGVAAAPDPQGAAKQLAEASWSGSAPAENGVWPGASTGRQPAGAPGTPPVDEVLTGIIESDSFKLGNFTLKSGKSSPFYIDLRRIPSFPALFSKVIDRYEELASPLAFDAIAAIPTAGLPIGAALALRMAVPLVYPRIPPKPHGAGNPIEGAWEPGQRVLLLDDLVTRATSKLEAAEILRNNGLIVEDLVVLIERGRAREELSGAGLTLYSAYHAASLIDTAEHLGLVDPQRGGELKGYLAE